MIYLAVPDISGVILKDSNQTGCVASKGTLAWGQNQFDCVAQNED